MQSREVGKTYPKSPMGGTPKPTINNLVSRKINETPSAAQQAISKLMTAYNSKAYAKPYAPLLYGGQNSFTTADNTDHDQTMIQAGLKNGDRLGFIARDINNNNGLEYTAGLDFGDVNRGYYESPAVKTPIGNFGYGYEQDTDFINYDPNAKAELYIQALANLLYR